MMIDETSNRNLWERAKDEGKMEERINNIRLSQDQHIAATDARFLRLETRIDAGFIQGQKDREAGNKTLGDMIEDTKNELKNVVAQINRNQGSLSTQDKIWGIIGILIVTALGTYLGKVF